MCIESPACAGMLSRGQYIEEWSDQLKLELTHHADEEAAGTTRAPRFIPILLGPFARLHRLGVLRGRVVDQIAANSLTKQ